MLVVKWAYVHGAMDAQRYDSLQEAIRSAFFAWQDGAESLESIEVVGERVYSRDTVQASEEWERLDRLDDERWEQQQEAIQAGIKVRSPLRNDLGWWDTYPTLDDARAAFKVLPPELQERAVLVNVPDHQFNRPSLDD